MPMKLCTTSNGLELAKTSLSAATATGVDFGAGGLADSRSSLKWFFVVEPGLSLPSPSPIFFLHLAPHR